VPLQVDDGIYFLTQETGNNQLYALDSATGKVRWKQALGGSALGDLAYAEGTLYVAVEPEQGWRGYLSAVDVDTQQETWRFTPPDLGRVTTGASLSGDTVYVGVSHTHDYQGKPLDRTTDYIFALDRSTGREKWKAGGFGGSLRTPAVGAGLVFANMAAVDAETGRPLWRGSELALFAAYAITDDAVLIVEGFPWNDNAHSNLKALDPTSGRELWAFSLPGSEFHVGPAAAGGLVYAGNGTIADDEHAHMTAVSIADGVQKWRFETGASYAGDPAYARGVLYFGSGETQSDSGTMHALDALTGVEKWKFEADSPPYSAPVPGDGMLFFFTEKGTLYALR
jgi:outer membrane protein assembly factor BamB